MNIVNLNNFCVIVFFFQAEDGIRDAQESRGLGDVYKRQTLYINREKHLFVCCIDVFTKFALVRRVKSLSSQSAKQVLVTFEQLTSHSVHTAVSYTHLTLPTIYSV